MTLSASDIEPIIFKLGLTNHDYAGLLSQSFVPVWFEDTFLGQVLKLVLDKKYKVDGKLLKHESIKLIASKIIKNESERVAKVRAVSDALDINLDEYDCDILKEETVTYLKNAAIFNTLATNMEDVQATKDVSKIMHSLTEISEMGFHDVEGLDYLIDIQEHIDYLKNPEAKITTGFRELDRRTSGGWNAGGKQLMVFCAQAGMGKSLVLSNMAHKLLKEDKFVVIVSLEMSEHVYATRIDGHMTGGDVGNVGALAMYVGRAANNMQNKNPNAKLVIKEYPPDTLNCNKLRKYCDGLEKKYGRKIDALFVDYINLMSPNNGGNNENSYTKVGNITKELRGLSYHLECPIVSATQLNRSGMDSGDLGLDNISDSMGIAHTADFVCGLFQGEGDREEGILNFKIMKNRLGGFMDTFPMNINYAGGLRISDFNTEINYTDKVVDDTVQEVQGKEKEETLEDMYDDFDADSLTSEFSDINDL